MKHTYIIAEAGVNHNGDLARALEMIQVAASAGCDAIKFQSFIPAELASPHAAKADYQKQRQANDENQLEMLSRLSLDFDQQRSLYEACAQNNIDFLSSAFDLTSLAFLTSELKLGTIKLASGEITNAPLLFEAARRQCKLIVSTGMSSMSEIDDALAVIAFGYLQSDAPNNLQQCRDFYRQNEQAREHMNARVSLLHCTTSYPCPLDQVNLNAMSLIAAHTGLPVGYSDHTEGITVSLAAAAAGARIIEKHFTLDRSLPGPDHRASLQPDELQHLVEEIRKVDLALGENLKALQPAENDNLSIARKSLVAKSHIKAGDSYRDDNITTKRPGTGISPMVYWDYLARRANRDYAPDDAIDP
jgi:N-acetylneuraminate synthase